MAASIMPNTNLCDQLGAFNAWRDRQLRLLKQLQPWLRQQGLYTLETRNAIDRAQRALRDEHMTVAVAGEFSRGKTELINALFFAHHGRRLLPADAGRTTMCPTEIFCDENQPPYLRLLPIETRRNEHSLASLRDQPDQWVHTDLDLNDPESLSRDLQKLTQSRPATRHEAAELGLVAEPEPSETEGCSIPRWRLAQLNIRHPLLAQGLRILDTPGLNAIGSEPELTFEMLPAAHAVLFVLAADTGVTRSDLHVWQRFIQRPGHVSRRGLMVVLNKTDTLWDELRSSRQIAESIVKQCREVALALGVSHDQVFATSAQKALLARVQNNAALEQRSGIASLEKYLGNAMMANRLDIIRHEHIYSIQQALDALETLITRRLERNGNQRGNLAGLADQSDAAIGRMLESAQHAQAHYQASVDTYKQSLAAFNQHGRTLLSALDVRTLDQTLDTIRASMTGAWTTHGLKEAMRALFKEINVRLEVAGKQTQLMRRLLRTVYRRFQSEHGFRLAMPAMISIVRHQVELGLLDQEAEIFRNSARTTLMEQHFVTKRYFRTIVSRSQAIFQMAYDEANHWRETALLPLSIEVKEHRDALTRQMADLRHAGDSRKTIQQRIEALQRDDARLRTQIASIARVHALLLDPAASAPARASGQN